MDLDKSFFPYIHLQGHQLPFTEEDIGKDVKITGTLRLTSIKFQGYNYKFEMTEIDFLDKVPDKGTVKARKRKKEERINIATKPILDEGTPADSGKEEKYESWLQRRKKKKEKRGGK